MLPSKFREDFKEHYIESFVITKSLDNNCLDLYPINEWKNFEKKLTSLSKSDQATRYIVRNIFSTATPVNIDRQGRIFVPPSLRTQTGILRNVLIIGRSTFIEIWSKEKWDQYNKTNEKPIEEVLQRLTDLGV